MGKTLNWDIHIHLNLPIKALGVALWVWLLITALGVSYTYEGIQIFPVGSLVTHLMSNLTTIMSNLSGGLSNLIPIGLLILVALLVLKGRILMMIFTAVVAVCFVSPAFMGFLIDIILYYSVAYIILHLFEEKRR